MELLHREAYITKKNKIKFGSDSYTNAFIILNPVKGAYNDKKSKLLQILELNTDCILEVKFSNGWTKWITIIGVDDDNITNTLVYFDSFSMAKGIELGTGNNCSIGICNRLEDIEPFIKECDINIRQVTRKGYISAN